MNKDHIPLICIVGPTASGKTKLAVKLAGYLNASIISADSRQVYRGMNIGTGKDLSEYVIDGKTIPYYMIDITEPGYEYNVFEYQRDFRKIYSKLQKEKKNVILCGGSGMYIESVLKNYALYKVPCNEKLRSELSKKSMEELTEILKTYVHLHNNSDTENMDRILRAIEIQVYYRENNIKQENNILPHILFYIRYPRHILRERISERLQKRLSSGMIEEVENLLSKGLDKAQLMYYGLEYKFITQYIMRELSYSEMLNKLNTAICRFAKRQETWFRRMEKKGFILNYVDGCSTESEKLQFMTDILNKNLYSL